MPAITEGYRSLFGEPFWLDKRAMIVHAFVSDVAVDGEQATLRVEVAHDGADWSRVRRNDQEWSAFFAELPSSYAYQAMDPQAALGLWGVASINDLEGAQRTFSVDSSADTSTGPTINLMRDLADAEGSVYQIHSAVETPATVAAAMGQPLGEVATEELIQQLLARLDDVDPIVAVLDVGQGAAAYISEHLAGRPLLYFDIGGGESNNQHTWPDGGVEWCFTESPPIVLSHWHRDHYAGATYGSEDQVRNALSQTWIAPDQKVGAKSKQLQARILMEGGRLILWPTTLKAIHTNRVGIGLASGTAHNDSGLVLLLQAADGRFSLFPGDAGYQYIDPTIVTKYQSTGLKTLVVAHHGGLLDRKAPMNVPLPDGGLNSAAIYSAGHLNSHGHPSQLASYCSALWTIVGTDSRAAGNSAKHLGEPRWGNTHHRAACWGNACSLAIWR
jgi:hypothetical protein